MTIQQTNDHQNRGQPRPSRADIAKFKDLERQPRLVEHTLLQISSQAIVIGQQLDPQPTQLQLLLWALNETKHSKTPNTWSTSCKSNPGWSNSFREREQLVGGRLSTLTFGTL